VVKLMENSPTLLKYKVNRKRTVRELFYCITFMFLGCVGVYAGFSQEDKSVTAILIGGFFAVCGFFSMVPDVRISIFDKTKNKFILERQGLFRPKIIKYDLNEIQTVQCDIMPYNISIPGYGTTNGIDYQVNVVLLSNQYVHLTSPNGFDRDDKQRMASDINTFLNL
jgi:hypothetical protein